MNRITLLKLTNPLLALLVLNQALTAIFADELFKLSPNAFGILHEGGGSLLVALVVVHLVLTWNWVKASYLKKHAPAAKA